MSIFKQKENSRKISVISKIGVFSVSLFVAASAVYLYSPVIGSHADSSAPVAISTEIGTVMSIKFPESIEYTVQGNELKYLTLDTTVITNNQYGYSLTFSAKGTQTAMKNGNYEIPSVSTDVINPGALSDNTYGYLSPAKDAPVVHPIPTEDNPALMIEYPSPVTSANQSFPIPLYFKFGPISSLASGQYSNTFVLSVYANGVDQSDVTIADFPDPTMQDFYCWKLANIGDSTILTDSRDGNKYTVKKLADNRCWMTENLRLIGKTITSADSNLPDGETWNVPASSLLSFDYDDTSTTGSAVSVDAAYYDPTYGGYYTFYTATAGWGTYDMASGNSPKDICPKGWRLPTGGGGTSGNFPEFQTLFNVYPSFDLMLGVPNFVTSGAVTKAGEYNNRTIELRGQGTSGTYWSSTIFEYNSMTGSAHVLQLYEQNSVDKRVMPASFNIKNKGFSVRCIAK